MSTLTMLQHSKSGLVPVLVDQFNDIIEWKQKVLQKEVESFEAQKTATAKVLPMLDGARRYSADDMDMSGINEMNKSAFPKLKRSKSQKCFSKKLNRVRMKAIKNTISEGAEMDANGGHSLHNLESVAERIARIKLEYQIVTPKPTVVTFAAEPMEIEVPPDSPPTPHRVDHQQMMDDLAQLKLKSFKLSPEPEPKLSRSPSPSPVSKVEIEPENKVETAALPAKPMPTYNVLLEKLRNIYRHNFVVKTQVVDMNSRIAAALGKATPSEGQCLCGEPFNFSDKTLQCILCLTKCHTSCASTVPTPCIKFVDPNLRPSKLISNYVYPRSRPSVPSILVNCCREIEAKCSLQEQAKPGHGGLTFSSLKLYYVESERLKLVKDECKKMLTQGKLGAQRMDGLTLDHLCGIVKYFLGEVCEPLFTPANWKEYSLNIHKKSEEELSANLLDTFDAMAPSNVQTLCFMLLHLKHLHKCGFQDLSILVDIFCPILLGELEVRRKWRLMKIMFQMEDNVLLSFVER